MKEEDARTKICPHNFQAMVISSTLARVIGGADGDRVADIMSNARCIASGCMMWREGEDYGYCGLAGKP